MAGATNAGNNSGTFCLTEAGFGWTASRIPSEFGFPARVERQDHPECFSPWNSRTYANLNSFAAKALISLLKGSSAEVTIVEVAKDQYAAERTRSNGSTLICTCNKRGQLFAAEVKADGSWNSLPSLPEQKSKETLDLSPIWAVYLMLACRTDFIQDVTVRDASAKMLESFLTKNNPSDSMAEVHFLSDMLYAGLKQNFFAGGNTNVSHGKIKPLTEDKIIAGSLNGTLLCGSPRFLNGGNTTSSNPAFGTTAKKAKAMFKAYASKLQWTPEEQACIPVFPDDYPVLPETITIARRFVESRKFKRPMNNFLWRGITSYGKSTGVEMLAYILNTPLLRLTCNSTMDTDAFLTNYIPVSESSSAGMKDIPDLMNIEMDPEGAYQQATGIFEPDIEPDEVFRLLLEAAAESGKASNTSTRYKLVESNYVIALRRGYICEIQEMSRIKDAGVMVTLNEYDRAGARIPLADGNFVTRHPNAMVVYTDNIGYTSCRPVDPSVIRRMDCVLDSYDLTDEQVRARVQYNTGFDDRVLLKRMMKIWRGVQEYCKDQEINEGEISVNELERWIESMVIEGGEYMLEETCRQCIVAKASAVRSVQDEIWDKVVTPLLASKN